VPESVEPVESESVIRESSELLEEEDKKSPEILIEYIESEQSCKVI